MGVGRGIFARVVCLLAAEGITAGATVVHSTLPARQTPGWPMEQVIDVGCFNFLSTVLQLCYNCVVTFVLTCFSCFLSWLYQLRCPLFCLFVCLWHRLAIQYFSSNGQIKKCLMIDD